MKIKKGDLVVVTRQELVLGPKIGAVGQVVITYTFDGVHFFGVDFGLGLAAGHDLGGRLATPTGWWVEVNSVKPDKKSALKLYFQ